MSRIFDMCEICKYDKVQQCGYNCIERREDRIFRFHTCPKFIIDDGQPLTNGEILSSCLKYDIDAAYNAICYMYDHVNKDNIIEWLHSVVEYEH